MAVVNSNTIQVTVADVDSTVLTDKNVALIGVILTAGGGVGHIALGDLVAAASYPAKLELDTPATGSIYMDLSNTPIIFPNGIRVKGASGVPIVTLIVRRI